MTSDEGAPLRLGVVGLGRAFVLMLPTFRLDPRVRLVAAAAPRPESRQAFEREFGGRTYDSVAELCADPGVEAVYIASPHQMHAEHVRIAAAAGKHMLVEKPLAVALEEGVAMVEAARMAGVNLIVGPSHSFDAPVLKARELIEEGRTGKVRSILAFNYTEFLYRPRRPEELDTAQGGGVLFSQGAHQIDIVRLLAGGLAESVYAITGSWDPARPTEGAYAAMMRFQGGAYASLTYSGYAHFDSDEFCGWVGELGRPKDPAAYGGARRALAGVGSAAEEAALKSRRTYGGAEDPMPPPHHEHFGPVVVSCDAADLRLAPDGVWIYGHYDKSFEPVPPPDVPRQSVIDALWNAVRRGFPPIQTGTWGLASLEVCHAILRSAASGKAIELIHQVPVARTSDQRGVR